MEDAINREEWTELLDLSLDGALPSRWQARVDAHLAASPDAASDVASLREAVDALALAPAPRPDAWFVERALQGVLREHRADTSTDFAKER